MENKVIILIIVLLAACNVAGIPTSLAAPGMPCTADAECQQPGIADALNQGAYCNTETRCTQWVAFKCYDDGQITCLDHGDYMDCGTCNR